MRLRMAMVAAAVLLLSGCWWEGPVFYPPDSLATQPFTPGLYESRSSDPADTPERMRMARLANGSWGEEADAKGTLFFARLPGTARDLWILELIATDSDDAGYGLIEHKGDRWTVDAPITCRGTEAMVRAAGGTVENDDPPGAGPSPARPSGSPTCRFDTRAALERALLAYAAAHPRLEGKATITRIGD
jgi:predicted small lipoprotein YifL